ncbi:autoimmune regulator isoform X2 [Callorhinchus milii]|uniref:autoimmune regulator isoform X2 n=1 Tax=Callorhinchus milii TaxID=7868 RepID=UPI0004574697|nr:autoimmune regulator isoform X2 [Callorhinchus milii]|eukprot:gi/632934247/ref/XP_007904635.1/ PREDICTED: autoimmune regulator-like isoform X2 [Callorhinchus milii]
MSFSQFTDDQVTKLLRRFKVEVSMAIDKMFPFLHNLRDKQIITNEKFKEIEALAEQKDTNEAIYLLLSWLEKSDPSTLRKFWNCLFKDFNLQKYPKLLPLQEALSKDVTKDQRKDTSLNHSLRKSVKRNHPDKEPTTSRMKSDQIKDSIIEPKDKGHDEEKQKTIDHKPRKERFHSQPADLTSSELPVSCGSKTGTLHKKKLAKGNSVKCIQVGKDWYSPKEFEDLGGRSRSRNWKTSIRSNKLTLREWMKRGYLSCDKSSKMSRRPEIKRGNLSCQMLSKMSRSKPCRPEIKDDVRLTNQAALNHEDVSPEKTFKGVKIKSDEENIFLSKKLPVSCGSMNGILHKCRFISGIHGKCIRTETKWCTPVEFEDLSDSNKDLKYWKRNIRCKSETLGKLIQKGYLKLHKLHCDCECCHPQFVDQNENNDDVCTVCKDGGDLICCDECPRAFHKQCLVSRFELRNVNLFYCNSAATKKVGVLRKIHVKLFLVTAT